MHKNKILWIVLLLLSVIPTFFTLLRPGYFPMQDDQHIFRLNQMDKCFKDGQIPCRWIPDAGYGYGYPQFNFYAPALYYLGEVLHLLGLQFIDAIKLIVILGFVFSGLGMFVLIKEYFGNFPAYLGSLFYLYSPYKAQQVYVRGSFGEFLAGVFFPLLLWSSYKLIKGKQKKYLLLTGLFLGLLLLTHNLLSMLFLPILMSWTFYWIYFSNNFRFAFNRFIKALLIGVGVSSFFTIPMIAERKFVHLETLIGGYFDYKQHFVNIKQLFVSNNWGYGSSVLGPVDDLTLSVGILHWIVGFLAIIFAILTFNKNKKISLLILGLGFLELLVLFMMHERSSFVWKIIPQLAIIQFPWRLLSFSSLILSFISGYLFFSIGKFKYVFGVVSVATLLILHSSFFVPKTWFQTNDQTELSGQKWERQLTSSIFDYLPIYAARPPEKKASDYPEVISGEVKFADYHKTTNSQFGSFEAAQNSRIRLPLFDFPGMRVTLNGEPISHKNNDCTGERFCTGLISFDVPSGVHQFRVKLENTLIRSLGNIISVFSIFILIYLSLKKDAKDFEK